MKIALDAMGGDHAPENIVHGAVLALRSYPHISRLFLTGDAARVEAELKKHGCNDGRIEIVHTTQIVDMSDSGLDAVRKKKDSSISRAVDLVKDGKAQAVVSAGHTGAAVTASLDQTAHAPRHGPPGHRGHHAVAHEALGPHRCRGESRRGASHLVQNAIMGAAYARHVLGRPNPEIGLMSNGTEEEKGNALTQGNADAHPQRRGATQFPRQRRRARHLARSAGCRRHRRLHRQHPAENQRGTCPCHFRHGEDRNPRRTPDKDRRPARQAGFQARPQKDQRRRIRRHAAARTSTASPSSPTAALPPVAIKNALRMACESIRHEVNPHIVEAIKTHHDSTTASPHANAPA